MAVPLEVCQALPKVVLHDHLDGGLRPETLIEEAARSGHQLPSEDPDQLAEWFFESANSGSLDRYLETFDHTVAVTQNAPALRRVAREFVEDQARDFVVYAEARWAPEQHLSAGLTLPEAVAAVRDGLAEGMARSEAAGRPILVRQILTAMRHQQPTTEIAALALAFREDSVCGFDIAGAEYGFGPARFKDSFDMLRREGLPFTIHAGEAAGVDSISEALSCGASRLGHGVRLVEDIGPGDELGEVAAEVLNRQIPLELCPSSNLQTGVSHSIEEHPFGRLARLGFNVTVNPDNRLVSRTTLSRELHLLSVAFGYELDDLQRFTLNAAGAAFLPATQRTDLADSLIRPGFARARS